MFLGSGVVLKRLLRGTATAALLLLVARAASPADANLSGSGWPTSSTKSVTPLDHTPIEALLREHSPDDSLLTYRFTVFGDQRAAYQDGEWRLLLDHLATVATSDPKIRFMVDVGDIVQDGNHSDQFFALERLLSPVKRLPYLVAAGNHELDANRSPRARANTAGFLHYLDDSLSVDRMYYRKDFGATRFLFLNSNDLVYGDRGKDKGREAPAPGSRAEAQMAWLCQQLREPRSRADAVTIVVMHHPIMQSSAINQLQARALWNYSYNGRTLPDILVDGGVDLVLTGHTHTHERFRLQRSDGKRMYVVNFSGRPRPGFLFFGAGARRAKDIRGGEIEFFTESGWRGLDRWHVMQEDPMLEDQEANQFGVFTVDRGELLLDVYFLDTRSPTGTRSPHTIWLK